MAARDKKPKPFVLSLNLSQDEALRFLRGLANPRSVLRRRLTREDPKRVLAEYDIVVADEDLKDLELPEPAEVRKLIAESMRPHDTRNPPPMDGNCRGWAIVYAAGGTAKDDES